MLGTQKRWQEDLFVAGTLASLIPDDHILKQVDKHAEAVIEENDLEDDEPKKRRGPRKKPPKPKKRSTTENQSGLPQTIASLDCFPEKNLSGVGLPHC